MIGIDTNVLLRLLTEDDATQAVVVQRLLAPLDAVPESVLINDIVLLETLSALRRLYGYDREGQMEVLGHLLSALTFSLRGPRRAQSSGAAVRRIDRGLLGLLDSREERPPRLRIDRHVRSLHGLARRGGAAEGLSY